MYSSITGSGIAGTDVVGSGIASAEFGVGGGGVFSSADIGVFTSNLMEFDESPDKKARRFGR